MLVSSYAQVVRFPSTLLVICTGLSKDNDGFQSGLSNISNQYVLSNKKYVPFRAITMDNATLVF